MQLWKSFWEDIKCPKCGEKYEADPDPYADYDSGTVECKCGHTFKVIARKEWKYEIEEKE